MPLADDSWDDTVPVPRLEPAVRRRTSRYRWVIVTAGLVSIVAVGLLIVTPTPGFVASGPGSPPELSIGDGASPDGPGLAALHSLPASPSPSATPSDGRGGNRPTGAAPPFSADSLSDSGTAIPSATPPPPPPPAVMIEAESAVLGGSAALTADAAASGGAYVGGIGEWGGSSGAGTLTFTSVNLPSSGTWRLTIYFLVPGSKGPRHATVVVSGTDPTDLLFAGSPTCCGTRTLDLSLSAGSHTIAISNPGDMGPAIDRITLALLPTA